MGDEKHSTAHIARRPGGKREEDEKQKHRRGVRDKPEVGRRKGGRGMRDPKGLELVCVNVPIC